MLFAALAATRGERIDTDDPALHLVHAFAHGPAIPPQLSFGEPLATRAQGLNRPRHKYSAGAALERLGCIQEQFFDCVSQFHRRSSIIPSLDAVYHTWDDLLFESS